MLSFNPDSYSQEEMERLVLGTILTISKLSDAQKLRPEHFQETRNRAIFEVMLDLDESEQAIESESITEVLKQRGIERSAGYLQQLKAYQVDKVLFKNIIDVLKDLSFKRKIGKIKNA